MNLLSLMEDLGRFYRWAKPVISSFRKPYWNLRFVMGVCRCHMGQNPVSSKSNHTISVSCVMSHNGQLLKSLKDQKAAPYIVVTIRDRVGRLCMNREHSFFGRQPSISSGSISIWIFITPATTRCSERWSGTDPSFLLIS